jgi:hypothetical protein
MASWTNNTRFIFRTSFEEAISPSKVEQKKIAKISSLLFEIQSPVGKIEER